MTNLEVHGDAIPSVQSVQHLDELFELPVLVLLKHSLTCPISAVAYTEVASFFADRPKIPAYLIPVQTHRRAAEIIEKRTGVRHESPQLLLIRDREAVAVASHFAITGKLLLNLFPSD